MQNDVCRLLLLSSFKLKLAIVYYVLTSSIKHLTLQWDSKTGINGKKLDRCNPFLYKSQGALLLVAITTSPLLKSSVKRRFRIIASAISVTWHKSIKGVKNNYQIFTKCKQVYKYHHLQKKLSEIINLVPCCL